MRQPFTLVNLMTLVSLVRTIGIVPVMVLEALLASCGQQVANAEQPPPAVTDPSVAGAGGLSGGSSGSVAGDGMADDAELRRGYGVVDMRFNACISQLNDHTFVGSACPSGIVIYGPYVPIPANSEIDVSFEIKPKRQVEIYADIVSQMGTQVLAGLNSQVVGAGTKQRIGYRVHAFHSDSNVESRVGVTGDGAEFEITNFTMTVR